MPITSAYRSLLVSLSLVSLALALEADSARVQSVSTKVFCNCGCGDVLAECSHTQCRMKAALKQEIAAAIFQGNSDEEILDELGTRHGNAILVTPKFRGFNTLLWLVPLTVTLVVLGTTLLRRRPTRGVSG